MKNPFKKKLTKWIPLGNYNFSDDDYVVMARKNLKTGMLYFKIRKISGWMLYTSSILPNGLIDVQKAWNELNQIS